MIEASIHSLQREDYFRLVSENYRIKMIRMINSFCCSFGKVEYAIKAIQLGSTAIGVKTSSGIILAVEKRVTSALMEATSVEKAMEIERRKHRMESPHLYHLFDLLPFAAPFLSVPQQSSSYRPTAHHLSPGSCC